VLGGFPLVLTRNNHDRPWWHLIHLGRTIAKKGIERFKASHAGRFSIITLVVYSVNDLRQRIRANFFSKPPLYLPASVSTPSRRGGSSGQLCRDAAFGRDQTECRQFMVVTAQLPHYVHCATEAIPCQQRRKAAARTAYADIGAQSTQTA